MRLRQILQRAGTLAWTTRRWSTVFLLGGVIGLPLSYLPTLRRGFVALMDKAGLNHTVAHGTFTVLWWLGIVYLVHRVLAVRLKHFRWQILPWHPPLVIGMFLAIPASLAWKLARLPLRPITETSYRGALIGTVLLAFWVFVPLLLKRAGDWSKQVDLQPEETVEGDLFSGTDATKLLVWLQQERPVRGQIDDRFSLAGRAERVLTALMSADRQTVGITGPFGCGKSSLITLVEEQAENALNPKARLWFARVSCWGFHNPAAAQEAVLQQALETLSEQIDVWTLRSLPEDYVKALSATSDWASFGLSILRSTVEPVAQLRRLSPLLKAVGARLVVVVEDVDRNGPGYDFSHIQAMLHQFREVEGLSFVLTADPGRAPLDFAKLCEHREAVPTLDHEQVATIVDQLRDNCLARYPDDVDPVSQRQSIRIQEEERGLLFDNLGFGQYHDWRLSLPIVLSTPRVLKLALRRFSQAWDQLHGEVDFDELLITSTLRTAAPEAFDFVDAHVRDFRRLDIQHLGIGNADQNREKLRQELREDWQRLVDAKLPNLVHASVLISKLFPAARAVFGIQMLNGH